MVRENLEINKMSEFNIENGIIELKLTKPRSKIRICDANGNHVSKPCSHGINFSNYYVEWMITNNELITLITQKFTREDILGLIRELQEINISLKDSDLFNRVAQRQTVNQTIEDFSIYKYEETFFSFEKNIDVNLQVKITFKMGDYTLAPHMFVLICLSNPNITLTNRYGNVKDNNVLGSKAKCVWTPSKETIVKIAKALAHCSENHKNDLIGLLERVNI